MVVKVLEGRGGLEGLVLGLVGRLWVALGLVRYVRLKCRLAGLLRGLLPPGLLRGLLPRSGGHLRPEVVEDLPRGLLRSPRHVGGRVRGSVAS